MLCVCSTLQGQQEVVVAYTECIRMIAVGPLSSRARPVRTARMIYWCCWLPGRLPWEPWRDDWWGCPRFDSDCNPSPSHYCTTPHNNTHTHCKEENHDLMGLGDCVGCVCVCWVKARSVSRVRLLTHRWETVCVCVILAGREAEKSEKIYHHPSSFKTFTQPFLCSYTRKAVTPI